MSLFFCRKPSKRILNKCLLLLRMEDLQSERILIKASLALPEKLHMTQVLKSLIRCPLT